MKKFTSLNQKAGELAENIACNYIKKIGFSIIERNFTRKCGELDIIAIKDDIVHFIEVKSVNVYSRSFKDSLDYHRHFFRPEDQMTLLKINKILRTINVYILQSDIFNKKGLEINYQLDLICVYLNSSLRKAKIKMIENICVF